MSDRLFTPPPRVGYSAVISDCGRYRYALERHWADGPLVLFIGLNPSTADAEVDDPTIRRCIGFAKGWGYGGLLMGNLFAWRATDPHDLPADALANGPENLEHLSRLAERASLVVAAWGAHWIARTRASAVCRLVPDLHVLELTARGCPRHPLYVKPWEGM